MFSAYEKTVGLHYLGDVTSKRFREEKEVGLS